MRRVLIIAALAGSVGCVTTQLTPEGQAVRVTASSDAAKGCKLIGEVDASDSMNGGALGQTAAEENTNRRIRNKAASMGANLVVLVNSSTGTGGSRARGEAYSCPEQKAP
jgi:hypothetical protein